MGRSLAFRMGFLRRLDGPFRGQRAQPPAPLPQDGGELVGAGSAREEGSAHYLMYAVCLSRPMTAPTEETVASTASLALVESRLGAFEAADHGR